MSPMGSASLTTNASGVKTSETRYQPYGGHYYVWNISPTDRDFTGQRFDGDVRLLDFIARRYDPYLGVFLQPDTIVPDPGNPQDLNRYAYARSNPLRYSDPSGNTPWDVVDFAFFLWSAKDFVQNPSWANAGWMAADALSLLPIVPSTGWIRRGGKLLFSADNIGDIARLSARAEEFSKVAFIPGASTLIKKLLSSAGKTVKGAEFELEFAIKNADNIEEMGRVLEVINGGNKEIDFVMKGNVFVNVKQYDWTRYSDFVLKSEIDNMVKQARDFFKYNPSSLKYVFKGSVPDSVRQALEAAGVVVEVVP